MLIVRFGGCITTNSIAGKKTDRGVGIMKFHKLLITLLIVFLFIFNVPVYAADKVIDRGLVDPDQPVSSQAPDYINSIDDIQAYIYENIRDSFASLHIDRDNKGQEIVVLSFASELSPSHKQAIQALADNPELIVFRLVDFTEQQLAEKQREISLAWDSFEGEGIKIHHTGVNVFNNRVEIGIEPFNKESIAKIHKAFGSEMVEVVEGHEIHLLAQPDGAEPALAPEGAAVDSIAQDNIALDADSNSEKVGFFQRIAAFFKSIFSWFIK